jgi:hypothetical protein
MDAAVRASDHWLNSSLEALVHIEEALSVLDGLSGCAEIAAHLDLALCRLREKVDPEGAAQANAVALRSLDNITIISSAGQF